MCHIPNKNTRQTNIIKYTQTQTHWLHHRDQQNLCQQNPIHPHRGKGCWIFYSKNLILKHIILYLFLSFCILAKILWPEQNPEKILYFDWWGVMLWRIIKVGVQNLVMDLKVWWEERELIRYIQSLVILDIISWLKNYPFFISLPLVFYYYVLIWFFSCLKISTYKLYTNIMLLEILLGWCILWKMK